MPLTLLSVPRETGRAWARALAEKRTPGENLAATLWAEHLGDVMNCFLCDAAIPTPPAPFTQLLPDKVPDQVVAVLSLGGRSADDVVDVLPVYV